MPTLNATVFPNEAYVLVEADWTSDPEVTHATVTRRNTVTGEVVTLRPYVAFDDSGNLLLDCGLGLWWDTEPPLGVPLEYCTVAATAPVAISQNCCFPSGISPWSNTGGTLVHDLTIGHDADGRSARFESFGTSRNPVMFQTLGPISAGLPVTISAWVISNIGYNGVQLSLAVTYINGTVQTFTAPVTLIPAGAWEFMTATFDLATDVTDATFRLTVFGEPGNTVNFNIDEIQASQDQVTPGTACETVTVPAGDVWLKSPLHPCDDVLVGLCSPMLGDCDEPTRVSYVGTSDEARAPNTVLLQPTNRKRPIPVNRVRRDVNATLRLLAHDCDAADSIVAANDPGSPLFFQAPADYCIEDRYISVGELIETRISVDQREDFRLMTLPYVVVDRPEGPADGVCGARITDLCDIYGSWAALQMAGLTYTDLLLGNASTDGPGQVTPPTARTWDDVEAEFVDWDAVNAGVTDWDELRDGV